MQSRLPRCECACCQGSIREKAQREMIELLVSTLTKDKARLKVWRKAARKGHSKRKID